MKRILAYTIALWLFSATFAFAVTRYSYNNGGHADDPVKIVKEGYTGDRVTPVTSSAEYDIIFNDGCIQIVRTVRTGTQTDTYEWGELLDTSYQWDEPTTEVLVEFCK